MAKYAKLTKSVATWTSGSQCDGQGRSGTEFAQIAPYGIISKAPSGALVVLMPMNDNESDLVGIADSLNKGTLPEPEEGEVVIGNYASGCFMHFKNSGEIDIFGKINHLSGGIVTNGKVEAADLETQTASFNEHRHRENGAGQLTDGPE